jgi:hypothetical protein
MGNSQNSAFCKVNSEQFLNGGIGFRIDACSGLID